MESFQLLASPWWVNLGYLIPVASYLLCRKFGLSISRQTLLFTALFGIAFGINEAIVVLYLRAATGLLPGFEHQLIGATGTLTLYEQMQLLNAMPATIIATEMIREAATLVILISLSLAVARRISERWALFLWMFAFWDIFYYVGLWLITRWPPSLVTWDVLFLIPQPWVSQVWFPVLVSTLCIAAVAFARTSKMPV
ncbi:hypothetical protein HYW59_03440 [Candidatus Kaiserbacteria bacterium]|nr:hypothetical protein [Candidatus Kaiserbacteria bacterium]